MSVDLAKKEMPIGQPEPSGVERHRNRTNDRYLLWAALSSVIFFIFALQQLHFDYGRLISGTGELGSMAVKMFPPNFSDWEDVLQSVAETFQMTWAATLLSLAVAFVLSFFCAANTAPSRWTFWFLRGFAALMRAIPVLVWAIIFVAALGLGPLPGVLALAIHSLGMMIKVFSDSIEEVDQRVLEAMRAAGAGWLQMIVRGVLPLVYTSFMSWALLRFDIDLRYATVLGMVGAGGIGWQLARSMHMYELHDVLFIVMVIFAMLYAVEMLSNFIKKRMINANGS